MKQEHEYFWEMQLREITVNKGGNRQLIGPRYVPGIDILVPTYVLSKLWFASIIIYLKFAGRAFPKSFSPLYKNEHCTEVRLVSPALLSIVGRNTGQKAYIPAKEQLSSVVE
jgi:hypothetical protein